MHTRQVGLPRARSPEPVSRDQVAFLSVPPRNAD
jgi:hypothetical protein